MATVRRGPTKSEVNRAGEKMRRIEREIREQGPPDDRRELVGRVTPHFAVILLFRALHQYPLTKATMGLRSMVKSEHCRVEVSQRLKRFNTILDKLERQPTMTLSRMQDIGGCRAVLDSIDEVRRVEQRLRKNRPPLRVADYISQPRSSGYRAVHVIVTYPDLGGDARAIEVQLRTRTMHEWAIAVERLGGRLRQDLKSGDGPTEVLDWLSAISEAMAIEEQGGTVSPERIERLRELRTHAVPFLNRPR
jgi:ppGpp synthetase/RelA/SpoT-type nucleotidyltranferase